MVKPDLKHNYYQDLDLPATASVDDVRKAYRKLALQFHPDRNAGREEECVPRFQAIQAANEILSDPTSKAKYDADRRKVGLYPTTFGKPSAPTPGNPYAARSDFPPPPRRTQPGTWQRPGGTGTAGPQPTGADRFTNFPRPAGATPQKNPAADRTQQFRAWQNMNQPNTARPPPPDVPPRQPPPRSPQPPAPGAAPTSARPRAHRKDTKMPTEEQIRAGMRHGKAAGLGGDDAAAHQSAWQAFQQKNAAQPGTSSKAPRRQPPATPKRPAGFDPNTPGSDERAAPQSSHYVHRHRSEDYGHAGYPPPPPGPPPAAAAQSPSSPTAAQRPFADPLRPFKSRSSNEDAPYAEGNRTSTPYSSYIGEKTAFNAENLRRSASVKDTTKLSPESAKSHHTRAQSVDPATRKKQTSENGQRSNGFAAGMFCESSSDTQESSEDEDLTETPEEMPQSAQPHTTASNTAQHGGPTARNIKTPKPPSRFFSKNGRAPAPGQDAAAHTDTEQRSMQERNKSANIFSFPIDSDTFKQTPGKSRSVEEINTNFSPNGFHGKFEGSGDYFTNANSRRPSPTHRNSSRRNQRAATTDSTPLTNGAHAPRAAEGDSSLPATSTPFSPEEWQKTFSDGAAFAWPPPPPSTHAAKASGRRSSRAAKANGAHTVPGTGKHPHVIDDDDSVVEVDPAGRPVNGNAPLVDEADAMDIDTPPPRNKTAPQGQGAPSQSTAAKEARLYSVEPSEWRQQQATQQQNQNQRNNSSTTRRAERKSAGESGFNVNLDDLRHTEPFAKGDDGLKNLADLSANLPFTSKASSAAPTDVSQLIKSLAKPSPVVPEGPTKLTKLSWVAYTHAFANYLVDFHAWNKMYLEHFVAFEKEAEDRIRNGFNWLQQTGDTVSGNGGFGSYSHTVAQEDVSREAWSIGREKHTEAVKKFETMRERVKRLAESGTLLDV